MNARSNTLNIRISKNIHKRLKKLAVDEEVSLSDFVNSALGEWLNKKERALSPHPDQAAGLREMMRGKDIKD